MTTLGPNDRRALTDAEIKETVKLTAKWFELFDFKPLTKEQQTKKDKMLTALLKVIEHDS